MAGATMQSIAVPDVKKDMNALATRSISAKTLAWLRDPAVSLWRKGAGFLALLYVVWPFDFVPDAIPIVGWLDDLGILTLASLWVMRQIKKHAAAQKTFPTPDDL